jgi:hypothetical protein
MNEDPKHVKKIIDRTKSLYDQSRDTVGKIYRDANLNNHETYIEVGDMSRELMTSLVEDINQTFDDWDHGRGISADLIGKPYYLMIHESKDLQMKTAIKRRMLYFGFRPYPEDDTVVLWKNPKTQDVRFCWCLPHWSDMDNVLNNPLEYDPEYVFQIKSWKEVNLKPFGFYWDDEERWLPNRKWTDRKIEQHEMK